MAAILTALSVALAPAMASAQATQRTTPEPAPNQGGFKVCNKSGYDLEVAKAVNTAANGQTPNIVSEGWYKFARGECATLWPGKLEYRYYLLYAQNKQSKREWKGDIQVCVSSQAFTIKHGICESSNYRRGFFQVDTKDYESWTQNLND